MFKWLWDWLAPKQELTEDDLEFDELLKDPFYDPFERCLDYPIFKLDKLEPRFVDSHEAFDLMMKWSFVTVDKYAHKVKLLPGEIGHDRHYRYIQSKLDSPGEHAL